MTDGGSGEPETLKSGAPGSDALIEAKDAHIASLEKQLEAERQAHSEARRLLAAALERISPQLEAPARKQEATQPNDTGSESAAKRFDIGRIPFPYSGL